MQLEVTGIVWVSTSVAAVLMFVLAGYLVRVEGRVTGGITVLGIIAFLTMVTSVVFFALWIWDASKKIDNITSE